MKRYTDDELRKIIKQLSVPGVWTYTREDQNRKALAERELKSRTKQSWREFYTRENALNILNDAIEHLRPLAVGDTQKGIQPNAEALAISTMAKAMVAVVRQAVR